MVQKLVQCWSKVGSKLADLEPLVQVGSEAAEAEAEAAEAEAAEAEVTTDNKATQASALSFELGMGVAKIF